MITFCDRKQKIQPNENATTFVYWYFQQKANIKIKQWEDCQEKTIKEIARSMPTTKNNWNKITTKRKPTAFECVFCYF